LISDFCDWFCEAVTTSVGNPLVTYFTNEPWFYFRSHVNTQQTLASRKLHTTIQSAMTLKLGWCAISLTRLFKPIISWSQ